MCVCCREIAITAHYFRYFLPLSSGSKPSFYYFSSSSLLLTQYSCSFQLCNTPSSPSSKTLTLTHCCPRSNLTLLTPFFSLLKRVAPPQGCCCFSFPSVLFPAHHYYSSDSDTELASELTHSLLLTYSLGGWLTATLRSHLFFLRFALSLFMHAFTHAEMRMRCERFVRVRNKQTVRR